MVSTFINPSVGRASELGVGLFEDSAPTELWPGASEQDKEAVIQAVYRQVLGNAYVMESERLEVPESKLKNGEITVREFVRQVAHSELYRSRFFESCPRYRAIELNFKHLLGRAPESYDEMQEHSHILDRGGLEAEINSYLDSDEYFSAFGENIVPYYRGYKTQAGKKMVGFTYFFQLLRGSCSSDKDLVANNRSRLNRAAIANEATAVVPPSSASSYGGLTNVDRLLGTVLKPQVSAQTQPSYSAAIATTQEYSSLQRQCQAGEEKIAQLQQQLAELRPVANFVEAKFSKWQSSPSSTPSDRGSWKTADLQNASLWDLQRQSEAQTQEIDALETELADVQRYAAIGAAQLNKWRSRTFSR